MRFYEMVLITRPDISEDEHKEVLAKIEAGIQKKKKKAEKGEILRVDDWGVRRLSYPIEKQSKGRYDLITMKSEPDCIAELEQTLRHSSEVFRFQTIVLKGEPKFDEKPKAAKTEAKPAVTGTTEKENAQTEAAGESAGAAA